MEIKKTIPFVVNNLCLLGIATDAYCLLEIYDKLKKWDRELKLEVDMEPCVMLTWLQPKKKKERYVVRRINTA